jgi:hypothetical protein
MCYDQGCGEVATVRAFVVGGGRKIPREGGRVVYCNREQRSGNKTKRRTISSLKTSHENRTNA